MREPKRYYWLKLPEGFFDDDTIKYIEELPNGVLYTNFYLKMCLKALQNEGVLMRTVGSKLIPYDLNSLSKLTGVDVDTVKAALEIFVEYELIQILDSGAIYMSRVREMVGTESESAARMRRLREKERLAELNKPKSVLPENNFVPEEDEPW